MGEKVKEILGMTLLYSFVLLFNAQLVLGQGRSCRTLIVSGRDAVTRDIDGTYKLMNNYWVRMDSTGRRKSYSNTRYIIQRGNQWRIIRVTRTGGTENYVDAIADKTGSCPIGSTWKVYLYGNRYEPSNDISVANLFPGEDCLGSDIDGKDKPGVQSIDACINYCKSIAGCNAVTFIKNYDCWVKTNSCDNHARDNKFGGIISARVNNPTQKNCRTFNVDRRSVCLQFVGKHKISDASSVCRSKQGKLPLPTNQKENDDYLNAFVNMLKAIGETRNTKVPLDVNDLVSEGHFVTYTGKTVEWFNWSYNRPDNHHNEDYVHMYVHMNDSNGGRWNDLRVLSGDDQISIFCEYD